jgi:phosphatidylglycerol:prolipoprotein diacylglycerol transferase
MFHLYGFFIGLAIVVGYSVAEKLEPKVAKVAPWVIGLGLIGARLFHVVDLWEYYGQNLGHIVAVWNGGMSIWGALIGGSIGLLITNHTFSNSQIENWNILGASAVALPLAQAIGRIGNGVNGEFTNKVFGLPWWSAEAVFDLLLFTLLWNLRGRSAQLKVAIYLFGYGLIRYFLQPYR